MLTKILILLYIAFVISLSSSVKASIQSSAVTAQRVTLDGDSGILNIVENLPSPCHHNPKIYVKSIEEKSSRVTLGVYSVSDGGNCVMMTVPFRTTFDLKALPLQPGKTYEITMDNSDSAPIHYTADGTYEANSAYMTEKVDVYGTIVDISKQENGVTVFKLRNGDSVISGVSPSMNLNEYENYPVWLTGYAVHRALTQTSYDPLVDTESQAPTVIVPVSVTRLLRL